jgi:penicillin-binding protein 1C
MTTEGAPELGFRRVRNAAAAAGHSRKGKLFTLCGYRHCILTLIALLAAGLAVGLNQIAPRGLEGAEVVSVTVLDRSDQLLRAFQTSAGRWRLPVEPKDVDSRYLAMLFAYEDQRFRTHVGVDPWALVRAAWQLARYGRIVSGGSTLTMQVVRLLEGEHHRSAAGKMRQALIALRLERRLTKDEILKLYLKLAPFGGNLEGVRAASLSYFGKEPQRLSTAQAALLVALPQSPEARRPDRYPDTARRARNRVLQRAVAAGIISRQEARRARAERVPDERREFPKLAPHLAEQVAGEQNAASIIRLTLDGAAQAGLEQLVRDHVKAQGAGLSAALIAVDHHSGDVIAHVGSASYFDETRYGAIDMTRAVRSPGSTLKPIIYGLSFEMGIAHPETLIEDRPVRFGTYSPKNFDSEWHGTVTIREALALSLNIPAVKVLDAIGPGKLFGRFQQIGLDPVLPTGAEPTLALALGGVGLRLIDLATLYAGLARGGEPVMLTYRRGAARQLDPPRARGERLLSPAATWYITEILRNAPAPANAKPGQIAYKTGTSYGYRDAWAVGFDGRHTVAVWVGRPDGAATPGLSGRATAAPILFDAFARLSRRRTPLAPAPAGVFLGAGNDLPPPLRRFRERSTESTQSPEATLQIAFPPDRAELEFADDGDDNAIVIKAEGGVLPLTWLVDGALVASDPARRELQLTGLGPGFVKLSVIDAKGRSDGVMVRVK